MTTLISVHRSRGRRRRCDANCYDATKPRCTCICGGANHGLGLHHAAINTRDQAEAILRNYVNAHPEPGHEPKAHVNPHLNALAAQALLFEPQPTEKPQ